MNRRHGLAPSVRGAGLGLALIFAFAGMIHAPGKAVAAEMDCGALLDKLAKTGELPKIAINFKDKTVKIVSSQGACQEPIEAWSRRPPPKAAKPGKKAAQPAPSPKGTASPATPVPALAPAKTPQPAAQSGPCDYRLNELWTFRVIKIEGISHWLARVFTVDLDGNRRVDNVKFRFKAKDDSERVISYFAPSPGTPGQAYPALKLPDESLIGRLCFGDLTFEKPEFFGVERVQKKWVDVPKPDLAAEMDARKEGVPYKPPERAKKPPSPRLPKEETPWGILLAIAAGLAVLVGGAVVVAKKLSLGQDDEDGEEDEEGEENEEDPAPARKKPAKPEEPEDSEE